MRRPAALALAALLAATGCSSEQPRDGLLRRDVTARDATAIGRHFEDEHAGLDALVPGEEWDDAVAEAAGRIDGMHPDRAMVELMRLSTLPGRTTGGDGHSGIFPLDAHEAGIHMFPLLLYAFPDGYYIVAAPGRDDLVGARLVAIDGAPVDEVAAQVEPLVPRDNDMTVLARLPQFLMAAEVLHGLGVTGGAIPTEMELERDGQSFFETFDVIHADEFAEATNTWHPMIPPSLPMAGSDEEWSSAYLPREDVVLVRYNQTVGDSFALGRRIIRLVRQHGPRGIVLDLRHNPGGENAASAGLLEALTTLRKVPLAVLVGRGTFSAAGYLSLHLQQAALPVFVGEPTGFSTRFVGDPEATTLPETGLVVNAGGVEWDEADDGSFDTPLLPDVEVETTAAAYFAGKDPVFEAALKILRRD